MSGILGAGQATGEKAELIMDLKKEDNLDRSKEHLHISQVKLELEDFKEDDVQSRGDDIKGNLDINMGSPDNGVGKEEECACLCGDLFKSWNTYKDHMEDNHEKGSIEREQFEKKQNKKLYYDSKKKLLNVESFNHLDTGCAELRNRQEMKAKVCFHLLNQPGRRL